MNCILLVDDDEDMLALTGRWLGREYEVTTCVSGEKAVLLTQSRQFDLILLDYYMPDPDGPATLLEMKKTDPTIGKHVVFLTGADQTESIEESYKGMIAGVLSKNTGKKELLQKVSEFLSYTDS